jgi:15-cis-phytoene synthase
MFTQIDTLDPGKLLALTYTKGELRDALTLLLGLDMRLGQVMSKGTEPLIGQMRIAWWRDALLKPAGERPKGEPLFQDLAILKYDLAPDMIHLADAWGGLLAQEEWSSDALTAFAGDRSRGIFGSFAKITGQCDETRNKLIVMGERWALIDLMPYCKSGEALRILRSCLPSRPGNYHVPGSARSLSMLALAAEQEGGGMKPGIRMLWHGLTGR